MNPLHRILYKEVEDQLRFHRAFCLYEESVTEHWGAVGERGITRKHSLRQGRRIEDEIISVLQPLLDEGYRDRIEEFEYLVISYEIDGMGDLEDLKKRMALGDRLRELLRETGLGTCDAERTISGAMESVSSVIDFEIAQRVIEQDLRGSEFGDFSRIQRGL